MNPRRVAHRHRQAPKRSEIFVRAELEQMYRTLEAQKQNISHLRQEIVRLREENERLKAMLCQKKQGKKRRQGKMQRDGKKATM